MTRKNIKFLIAAALLVVFGLATWGYVRNTNMHSEEVKQNSIQNNEVAWDGYRTLPNGADPDSFQIIESLDEGSVFPMAKDKTHVWFVYDEVSVADPSSFKVIMNYYRIIGVDAEALYFRNDRIDWHPFKIFGVKPLDFKAIVRIKPDDTALYSRTFQFLENDGKLYVLRNLQDADAIVLETVPGGDPSTLVGMQGDLDATTYAKDSGQVYCKGVFMPSIDAATAHAVHNIKSKNTNSTILIRDKNNYYDSECRVAEAL
jgi:hypothetical protein